MASHLTAAGPVNLEFTRILSFMVDALKQPRIAKQLCIGVRLQHIAVLHYGIFSLYNLPDPSERPSLPMSGTVMAAVATPSVGMVVYTTGSDCTTTGMVCSWPTLLGMLTEGIVWMTWRICWPPAPCVAKIEPGERT